MEHIGKTAAAGGALMVFVFFLVSGGLFVGLGTFLPSGLAREITTVALGAVFAVAFLYMLVVRIRSLFADNERYWSELLLALVNVVLLWVAFAAIYRITGIRDASGSDAPQTTKDFADCLYFSVVTFTTVGYGDYHPLGIGRIMAVLEAFVGYLVLGVLASTSAQLLQKGLPKSDDEEASED
ncbi:MAG: hypothetical protein CMN30_20020 [Sandaracinus sp.]|nr:hypothetical protein [Sandaracinus sp.]|tara:strand:- start:444 stop:989 length:546 start_codon:yes stop_codon:yes gene_type:complete